MQQDSRFVARYWWHVHHELLLEREHQAGIQQRIQYIKIDKPKEQIPLRLKLLREATIPEEIIDSGIFEQSNLKAIMELHAKQCHPQCPWRFRDPESPYIDDGNIFWPENFSEKVGRYTLARKG